MGNINKDVVKNLIVKVIKKEKEFLNEKGMTETQKVKCLKDIIEEEVNEYDN